MKWKEIKSIVKNGDKIKRECWTTDSYLLINNDCFECDLPMSLEMFGADDWEIIPVEPVILTSMQIRNIVAKKREESNWLTADIDDLIEIADKNGQLKERQNLQPLIDSVAELIYNKAVTDKNDNIISVCHFLTGDIENVKSILSTFKPLEHIL